MLPNLTSYIFPDDTDRGGGRGRVGRSRARVGWIGRRGGRGGEGRGGGVGSDGDC